MSTAAPFLKQLNIVLAVFFIMFLFLGSGRNLLELVFTFACFATITNLFLIRQPIIFFTLAYHAVQATVKVFYAEFNNIALNTLTNYNADADLAQALRLSCTGLILLSVAISIFLPKKINKSALTFNIKKLLFVYIGLVFVEFLASRIGQLGGLYQLIYKLSVIKWGLLFLITYTSLQQKKNIYFVSVVAFEVLIGLISFFSTFKSALFVVLISLLILGFHYFKIKRKYFIIFGSISLILLFTWQNIKEDYRMFLSGGEKTQSIVVDFDDAYDKIFDLVQDNSKSTSSTIDKTIDRLSYTDFFAEAVTYIPSQKPHTHGALWVEGVMHVLKPRLFFPDKKSIDDSEKTMKYTGLLLAGSEQGTSISLGYMAESYVDFGSYLFVLPIILLGLFIGWLFKKLFESNIDVLYCWALAIPFYFQFYGFEMASEKVLGSIVTYAIVVFILIQFGSKRFKWLEA